MRSRGWGEPLVGDLTERETLRRIGQLDPVGGLLRSAAVGRWRSVAACAACLEGISWRLSFTRAALRCTVIVVGGGSMRQRTCVRRALRRRHVHGGAIGDGAVGAHDAARICRITGIYGPGRTFRRL